MVIIVLVVLVASVAVNAGDFDACEARDVTHTKCGDNIHKNPMCYACMAQACIVHYLKRDCESLTLCLQGLILTNQHLFVVTDAKLYTYVPR